MRGHVGGAFITYNNPESRANCVDEYASPGWSCCPHEKLKLRGEHMLKVKSAPEASDLIWENVLRPNFVTKAMRKATSMLMIFILLIAAIGVIVYAKDTLSKSRPAVACPNTVYDATTNPAPMLNCKAIWDLASEDAINNATSETRRSVDMFISNIKNYEKCGDFIVKAGLGQTDGLQRVRRLHCARDRQRVGRWVLAQLPGG